MLWRTDKGMISTGYWTQDELRPSIRPSNRHIQSICYIPGFVEQLTQELDVVSSVLLIDHGGGGQGSLPSRARGLGRDKKMKNVDPA